MGVNKLDIEFEDEEEIEARKEAERKKAEAVADIDLSFGAHEESEAEETPAASEDPSLDAIKKARKAAREKAKGEGQSAPAQQAAPQQQAAPVQQAVPSQQVQQPVQQVAAQPQMQTIPQQQVFIGPDYKLGDELKKVAASNQILAIEIEARVKVEVTQQLTEITAKHHADAKLLEHKINKLLTQMNQKAPALKNELMMIKKLLKEHAALGDESEDEKPQQPAQKRASAQGKPQQRPVKKKAA